MGDATRVQELAGNEGVAKTTLAIPHPYPIEAAESWIESHPRMVKNGTFPFAMVLKSESILVGTMTICVNKSHEKGELAYWGNGYATEAAAEIVRHSFEDLNLNRVWARAMSKNPASVKVMENIGMKKKEFSSKTLLNKVYLRIQTSMVL